MKEEKSLLRKHKLTCFLPLALALGLFAQWLLIGHSLGISWLVLILSLLAALYFTGRRAGLQVAQPNRWLWLPLPFFATMVFIRANPFLTFLNIITTVGLLAFVFFYYAAGSVRDLSLAGIVVLPWRMAALSLIHVGPAAAASFEHHSASHVHRRRFVPVLRGGVLALPIIFLFTTLLASADLVFQTYLQRLVGLDLQLLTPFIGRGLVAFLIATVAAGALAISAIRGLRQEDDSGSWVEQATRKLPLHISIGAAETGTIMLLVSGLFLSFVLLQVRYLFGGKTNINIEGFTYAEYARRGFFELVLVASLSLGLILLLNWLTRRETKHQLKSFNLLSTILIGLVLLILVTAFWRMRLYQQAYGYTELRLIVLIFELWLGLLLIWFLLTLWSSPENFAIGFLIVVLGFVATLNLINLDARIVQHNLERYRLTGDLDIVYLTNLSADAVPKLVQSWPLVRDDDQLIDLPYCYRGECQSTLGDLLNENLYARYMNMLEDRAWLAGRSFHHARYQANQALACFYSPQATAVKLGLLQKDCPQPQ